MWVCVCVFSSWPSPALACQVIYRPSVIDYASSLGNRRAKTSGSFLCGLSSWQEGDYVDDGELNSRPTSQLAGLGIEYGSDGPVEEVPHGRHTRLNYNNVTRDENGGVSSSSSSRSFSQHHLVPGHFSDCFLKASVFV